MTDQYNVTQQEIDTFYKELSASIQSTGYYLNTDTDFVYELIKGLIQNQKRYGYPSCPCRLAEGSTTEDMDIICPCDYRDADLTEYGSCYCGLYVSEDIIKGKKKVTSIPERRPSRDRRLGTHTNHYLKRSEVIPYPVWRCRICGYLCARDEPPERCPICKAHKERFERFL